MMDTSRGHHTIHHKFTKKDKEIVVSYRKKQGYSGQKLRIKLMEQDIFMSESAIKRIVKYHGLSNGNKMEGIRLKWVRFERENPNSMWQINGTELVNGK